MAVAVWDLDGEGAEATAADVRAQGGDAAAWTVDVADREAVRAAAAAVHARWDRADVLVRSFARFSDTPVGRVGQPEDIAHGVRYLVSPEAGFVTGQVLGINGG